jgi:hypothetical protein
MYYVLNLKERNIDTYIFRDKWADEELSCPLVHGYGLSAQVFVGDPFTPAEICPVYFQVKQINTLRSN